MPDLAALLARLRWSQGFAARVLGCDRHAIRRALAGEEPWASAVAAAAFKVEAAQAELWETLRAWLVARRENERTGQ